MEKRLEFFSKTLIGATFFVPLVLVSTKFIFPFIVPKILLFRSLVLLILAGYILLLVVNWQKYQIKFSDINLVVSLFFVSFCLSTFFGVDWYKSFWDNHERMLGLFTIFHFIIFYFVSTTLINKKIEWYWFFRIFLLAGTLVMLLGVIQRIDSEFLLNKNSHRVSATLGNAIYYSGYGLFLFFIGILLFFKEKNVLWKIGAIIGGLLGFFGIFLGGTRGTLLGLLAGVFVVAFCYLVISPSKKLKLTVIFSIFILGFGLLIFRNTALVRGIPVLGRLLDFSSLMQGTGGTRIMAWRIAISAWLERPLFGWGPNNYYYAFNEYYNPKLLEHGFGETWFDNAHSSVFNTLTVQGIIGFILYVGLFTVPIYLLWKKYRAGQLDKIITFFSIGFLTAHFVHNAFVFENPTSYLYFFFFLAFINAQISNEGQIELKERLNRKMSGSTTALVFFVTFLLVYFFNISPARANMATLDTMRYLYSDPFAGLKIYNEQASQFYSPHLDDIRMDFSRTVSQIVNSWRSGEKDLSPLKPVFERAFEELNKNRLLHPLDIRVNLELAQMSMVWAIGTKDYKYLLEAEKQLDDALSLSPKRQQIQYMLAPLKAQLNKPEEAIKMLRESVDNDPKVGDGWMRLAMVYAQLGQKDNALSVIKEAEERGVKFGEETKQIIEKIKNQ